MHRAGWETSEERLSRAQLLETRHSVLMLVASVPLIPECPRKWQEAKWTESRDTSWRSWLGFATQRNVAGLRCFLVGEHWRKEPRMMVRWSWKPCLTEGALQ